MDNLNGENLQQQQGALNQDGENLLNSNQQNDQNNGGGQLDVLQNNDQNSGDNQEDNSNNKDELKQVKEANNFLDEIGRDYIDDMITNYEQITDILQDEEELSKLSKDEIINIYKTEAKLKEQLDRIIPMLESENNSEIENKINSIENPAVQEYIKSLSEDITDPEELDGMIEFATELLARAGGSQGSNNDKQVVNSKKEIGGNGNQKITNDIDPVKGMLSPDPKVREQAAKAMDQALEQMLASQFN